MHSESTSPWSRLSILEARIQQESARRHADQIRLGLLRRMRSVLLQEIAEAEMGLRRLKPCRERKTA